MLPNLILAGVERSGTTSLYSWLGQHPEIRPGAIKAHRYFRYRQFESDPASFESYLENFRGEPRPVTFDGHGGYCDLEPPVLESLRRTLPEARVVIVLREPVARAISWYRYIHSRFLLDRRLDFGTYVERCLAGERSDSRTAEGTRQLGVVAGEYARWLPAWGEAWGDALRVVYFDDLRADPERVIHSLCEWLDLDPAGMAGWRPKAHNASVGYRWAWLHRQAIRTNEAYEASFRRRPRLKSLLRSIYQGLNSAPAGAKVQPEAVKRLRRHYERANRDLGKVLASLGHTTWPTWLHPGR